MNDESPILIDSPGDVTFDREFLEKQGHPVLTCGGPGEKGRCPILEGEHCDKLDAAHGVIFELDLDRERHRLVLERYLEILPEGMPLQVMVKPGQHERYADLLDRVPTWAHEPSAGELDGFAAQVESVDRWESTDH